MGVGLAVTLGPTFISWVGRNLKIDNSIDSMLENDPNRMVPLPQPLSASSPPMEAELKVISAYIQLRLYRPSPMLTGLSESMDWLNGHRYGIGNNS